MVGYKSAILHEGLISDVERTGKLVLKKLLFNILANHLSKFSKTFSNLSTLGAIIKAQYPWLGFFSK